MNKIHPVIIAGAGSGDPELLTIKACNAIKNAEVILVDRLVSREIISCYASDKALIIDVGKQCSKGIHTPQMEINQLIIKYAIEGKKVVRLKGGDISLFSNILDELEVLKENEIPYELVPGVSAAFSAAAYTAIPLTARNFSRGVRLLTLYNIESIKTTLWKDWALTDDTLVFYMSGQKINTMLEKFRENNCSPTKKIAVIEQASTPEQKTTIFSLEDKTSGIQFNYVPTLVIIGNVVNLHNQYKWFTEKDTTISYFDLPLIKESIQ